MILIKSAQLIDGTGGASRKADLLIKGDRISAIGNFSNKKTDTVIDGQGLYVAPGFIDIQSNADHYLSILTHADQKHFLKQGVTTIMGGHCGSSLAPLLYGTLESIRKWTDPNRVNVDWHTMKEFLKTLSKMKIGVNFGTFVGHSTIRRALLGESLRDLTTGELDVIQKVTRDALQEGAFGFSTGLAYVHSRQTPYHEIKILADAVAKENAVYSTHLRNEREGLLSSVQEALKIAEETGVKTLISHLRPIKGFENDFIGSMKEIESKQELDVHFNGYPFDTSIVPIYTLLPLWAQGGGFEEMNSYITTPTARTRILEAIKHLEGDDIRIAQAKGNNFLLGKTLTEFAKNREESVPEALLSLMILTKLRAVIFYRNIDLGLAAQSLMKDYALVTANSASLVDERVMLKHDRFTSTFTKYIELVRKMESISLERAIQKITSDVAKKLGLSSRGELKEGNFGDVTVFSLEGKNSINIKHVVVNGRHVVKDGLFKDACAGRVLSRK